MVSGVGKVEISEQEIERMKDESIPAEKEGETIKDLSQKVDRIIDALSALSGGIFSKLGFSKNEGND